MVFSTSRPTLGVVHMPNIAESKDGEFGESKSEDKDGKVLTKDLLAKVVDAQSIFLMDELEDFYSENVPMFDSDQEEHKLEYTDAHRVRKPQKICLKL